MRKNKESKSSFSFENENKIVANISLTHEEDLEFLHKFAKERVPVSTSFSTMHASSIFMYHSLNAFCDDIWYLKSEGAVVLFKKYQNRIDIFDIISRQRVSLSSILKSISGKGPTKVVFHYTQDNEEFELAGVPMEKEGALFVKTNGQHSFPSPINHPVTFEA